MNTNFKVARYYFISSNNYHKYSLLLCNITISSAYLK
nr:MAG TPA: hypothetical protein [Caudoviricetes sp.]